MSNPITPVEALQHEIELARHEVRTSEGAFRYNKLAVKYLAALELAKADALVEAHYAIEPEQGNGWNEWRRAFTDIHAELVDARTKLNEVLQR